MLIKLSNYKKEKCGLCGEEHICTDVFNTNMCNKCMKEYDQIRNITNNILRTERPIIKKRTQEAFRVVK